MSQTGPAAAVSGAGDEAATSIRHERRHVLKGRRNSLLGGGRKQEEQVGNIYHVGLVNLGNSCFYNTILQALAISQPLAEIIATPPASSPALQALSPASPTYNPDPDALPSPLPITAALITLLKNLDLTNDAKRGQKVLNPKTLLRHLSAKHEEYAQATQQDAHEILRHLIDGVFMEELDLIKKVREANPKPKGVGKAQHRPQMTKRRRMTLRGNDQSPLQQATNLPTHDEEGPASGILPNGLPGQDDGDASSEEDLEDDDEEDEVDSEASSSTSSSSSDSDGDDKEEQLDWDADGKPHVKRKPFIANVFDGKLASIVICEECKHVSQTREDFMDISLSLRDDAGIRQRKRDKIRRTLRAGFFSKQSGNSSSKDSSSAASSESGRRQPISLSENEASSSASEFDSDDDANAPDGLAALANGGRSRHNSLDPSKLGARGGRPWTPASPNARNSSQERSRSPLGRALSVLSSTSGSQRTGASTTRKPKIPKPTAEQVAYIRRLLVEIPGASSTPLPIRVSRPPGQGVTPSSASTTSSVSSSSSMSQSMASLKLAGPDQRTTDLYECFRQFTSVEVLEGDNSFACRNCWKHLNPVLVRMRQDEKDAKKRAKLIRKVQKAQAKREAERQVEIDESTPMHSPRGGLMSGMPLPAILHTRATEDDVNAYRRESVDGDGASAAGSSLSLASEPSLVSDSGTDSDAGLADAEEDSASQTDEVSIASDSAGVPLTTANVEALSNDANDITPSASAAPSVVDGHAGVITRKAAPPESVAAKSGASLSTSYSNASKQPTSQSSAPVAAPPPKKQRYIMRRAHKRYLISAPDLPPVLVIHLKRFQQTNKSSLFGTPFTNLKKRDDDLSFPQELDLAPFLAPTEPPPKRTSSRRRSSAGAAPRPVIESMPTTAQPTLQSEYTEGDATYVLYAVVVHFGTLSTGHYSAYVKSNRYGTGPASADAGPNDRRWFFCSDEDVRACSVEEVLRCKAYILFYERVKATPVASSSTTVKEEPALEAKEEEKAAAEEAAAAAIAVATSSAAGPNGRL